MKSPIPWEVSRFVRDLVALPAKRRALRRFKSIRRSTGGIRVGFGGVLDDGRPVHGGAVKLVPLRDAFGGSEQEFNLLYAVSSSQPLFAEELFRKCRGKGIPIVWNQNGVAYSAWAGRESERFNGPMRRLRMMADHVVYQSHFCRTSAERYLGRCDLPSSVLYNPVDLGKFSPAPPTGCSGPLRLLAAGTHGTPDRVSSVIGMVAELRRRGIDSTLTIAGRFQWRGGERDAVTWAGSLRVGDLVRRLPRFSQEDAADLYRAHDLLVHPKYMDPCPTVVIEALACGLPVVGSASGGMPELVPDSCGALIPSDEDWSLLRTPSGEQLAEAVERIMPDLLAMSRSARKRAEEHHDAGRWVEAHRVIFEKLVG